MAKPSVTFVCADCGGESPRWAGQCPHCRAWNTLQEFKAARDRKSSTRTTPAHGVRPVPITDIPQDGEKRRSLDWAELNRVLGGGIVPGSLVLVGGEPGVGKSTLLMHVAEQLARAGATVLYVSGEESAQQVRMRAARLRALAPGLLMLAENDLDAITQTVTETRPGLAIVDSIQTVYDPAVESAAGTVSQVREGAARLMRLAKSEAIPIFLVGHVTKEGTIAGPRVLEHMVDTVLYLEGDRQQDFRILRATKNRFGSTDEIGIFSMGETGLQEVPDPSLATARDGSTTAVGTVVVPALEGTRPLLVELQTLVAPTHFGLPRRTVTGLDVNRLHMLVAVLEKRARLSLGNSDIFANVAGGLKLVEPAVDLGLALSIVGNVSNRPLAHGTVVIGEVGLTGEIRRVGQLSKRLAEAERRGYRRAIIPAEAPKANGSSVAAGQGMELIRVKDIAEAIQVAFGRVPDSSNSFEAFAPQASSQRSVDPTKSADFAGNPIKEEVSS